MIGGSAVVPIGTVLKVNKEKRILARAADLGGPFESGLELL